jgi:hypothetical protein
VQWAIGRAILLLIAASGPILHVLASSITRPAGFADVGTTSLRAHAAVNLIAACRGHVSCILIAMNASDVAAAAAAAAAIISIANVGFTSYLAHKREYYQWTRSVLPELILEFKDAATRYDAATKNIDWESVDDSAPNFPGESEFREMVKLRGSLEVFASQPTIDAAYELIVRANFLMIRRAENAGTTTDSRQWDMETARKIYDEAYQNFLRAARSEMGMPPISPGPPRRRKLI